jgi:5-methylcytosine-specific restriction endonuclease McrA
VFTKRKYGIPYREWRALKRQALERDGFRCLRCNGATELTTDHIIPVAKGGATNLDNLQTLCRGCNGEKAARTIDYRQPYLTMTQWAITRTLEMR